jgi:hypothetical protein
MVTNNRTNPFLPLYFQTVIHVLMYVYNSAPFCFLYTESNNGKIIFAEFNFNPSICFMNMTETFWVMTPSNLVGT